MRFKDDKAKEQWEEGLAMNDDPYGGAVYIFAQEWAKMMEAKLAEGAKLEDIAKDTSYEASKAAGDITGFMYGCGVGILSNVWEHGEELRCWHNLDTQIKDEGEKANEKGTVLNPALINVETNEK